MGKEGFITAFSTHAHSQTKTPLRYKRKKKRNSPGGTIRTATKIATPTEPVTCRRKCPRGGDPDVGKSASSCALCCVRTPGLQTAGRAIERVLFARRVREFSGTSHGDACRSSKRLHAQATFKRPRALSCTALPAAPWRSIFFFCSCVFIIIHIIPCLCSTCMFL